MYQRFSHDAKMTLYGASETIFKYLYIKDKRRTQCPHFTRTQGTSRNISIRNGLHYLSRTTFYHLYRPILSKRETFFWGSIIYIKQRTPPAGSGSLLSSFYPLFLFFLGLIIRLSAFFLFFQILWREMKVCVIKWQNLIKWLSNRMAPHPMTIVNITTRLLFEIPFLIFLSTRKT